MCMWRSNAPEDSAQSSGLMDPQTTNRFGRLGTALLLGLLAAALIAVFMLQRVVGKLEREVQSLPAVTNEVQRPRSQDEEVARLRAENQELERLRKDNQELHKLRNEVRQLREQRQELEKLREENLKLRAVAQNRRVPNPSAAAPQVATLAAWIGVAIRPINFADNSEGAGNLQHGVVIARIDEDSPAALSDLEQGDVVTAIDAVPVATPRQLREAVSAKSPGQTIVLDVVRNGQSLSIPVQTSQRTQ